MEDEALQSLKEWKDLFESLPTMECYSWDEPESFRDEFVSFQFYPTPIHARMKDGRYMGYLQLKSNNEAKLYFEEFAQEFPRKEFTSWKNAYDYLFEHFATHYEVADAPEIDHLQKRIQSHEEQIEKIQKWTRLLEQFPSMTMTAQEDMEDEAPQTWSETALCGTFQPSFTAHRNNRIETEYTVDFHINGTAEIGPTQEWNQKKKCFDTWLKAYEYLKKHFEDNYSLPEASSE